MRRALQLSKAAARLTACLNNQARLVSYWHGNDGQNEQLRLVAGVRFEPHPAKKMSGGEDSNFIDPDGRGVGVADGVGGWRDRGINPAHFARSLMSKVQQNITTTPLDRPLDPRVLLDKAHQAVKYLGSSTAVVAVLDHGLLRVVNVGDSGLLVIRDEKLILRTDPLIHEFNFPFQLGGPGAARDTVASADYFELPLLPKDIILLATDGLFDNLFDERIVQLVTADFSPYLGDAEDMRLWARDTAELIVERAIVC
jgi:protein phosphatase PTC7